MQLFASWRERALFLAVLLVIFAANLGFRYYKYLNFLSEPQPYITGIISHKYEAMLNGMPAKFITLKSGEFEISTRVAKSERYAVGDFIGLEIYTIGVSFSQYLGLKMFVKSTKRRIISKDEINLSPKSMSFIAAPEPKGEPYTLLNGKAVKEMPYLDGANSLNKVSPIAKETLSLIDNYPYLLKPAMSAQISAFTSIRDKVSSYIAKQHEAPLANELYQALFLASPVSKQLRQSIQRYGASHLIAISGYHMGVITFLVFALFAPIFKFIYARYFAYLDYRFGLGVFSFIIVFLYLFIIGFAPSFLRACFMGLFGFYLLVRGISLKSFELFFACVFMLVAIFPELIFSLGFFFSCFGVWLIYIYFNHFKFKSAFINVICLNLYLFFCMIVIVSYFFGFMSFTQIFALGLSLAFVVFYPLAIVLHVFGYGGIFDDSLIDFLNLSFTSGTARIDEPLWFLLGFVFLSLLAYRYKPVAIVLPVLGFIVWVSALLLAI